MEEDPGKTYPAPDLEDVKKKDKERPPPLGARSPYEEKEEV